MRPAEVIGSWATTHPPGRTASAMRAQHHRRVDDVEEQEAAEGEIDRLGQAEVLAGLGDGEHLAVGGGGLGHLVAGHRVAVDGVDPSVVPDDLGQRHRDVPTAGADVDAGPARADPEPVERGGQRSAVDIVPQAPELHHRPRYRRPPPRRLETGARLGSR